MDYKKVYTIYIKYILYLHNIIKDNLFYLFCYNVNGGFMKDVLITIKDSEKELNNKSIEICLKNNEMFLFHESILSEEMNLINMNIIFYSSGIIGYPDEFTRDIFTLAYKNLISLYSCIYLMKKGILGSARIIFRNIYENLLIDKYFSISKDIINFNKLKNGDQLSIKNKTSKESIEFWDILNKYTHDTVYAQDFDLYYDKSAIENCNCFLSVLLEMNYHILNTHISKKQNII